MKSCVEYLIYKNGHRHFVTVCIIPVTGSAANSGVRKECIRKYTVLASISRNVGSELSKIRAAHTFACRDVPCFL
jgi:hypothetical protein